METDAQAALKTLNLRKIVIPILFGLLITAFLFYRSGKVSSDILSWLCAPNWTYLCMAACAIVLRELGHICRLRLLSDGNLSWKSCFYVATLWEFASAVTPSVVGGGLVAIFLFSKEGLSLGKALAYVIVNGILDNLFFLLAASYSFGGGYASFFTMTNELSGSVKAIFFTNYTILFIYTVVIASGVFLNPNLLKWILMRTTSIRFLKRWRRPAYQLSKDIMVTSHEFRGKRLSFWCKLLFCTILTWMVRYVFLNLLIASYAPVSWGGHWAIFCKQIIMWALMLVPLAPGGSGIAEVLFQAFFEHTLGDYTLIILILWRACSFYLYLTVGAFFLPKWIRRVFRNRLAQ